MKAQGQTQKNIQAVADRMGESLKEIERVKYNMEYMLQNKRSQMMNKATMIQRCMENFIEKVEKDGDEVSINDLGEMQNMGGELDRMIGEFCTMRRMLEELSRV
jgi:hypothetical protein